MGFSISLVLTIVSGIMIHLSFNQIICKGWGCFAPERGFSFLTAILGIISLVFLKSSLIFG